MAGSPCESRPFFLESGFRERADYGQKSTGVGANFRRERREQPLPILPHAEGAKDAMVLMTLCVRGGLGARQILNVCISWLLSY